MWIQACLREIASFFQTSTVNKINNKAIHANVWFSNAYKSYVYSILKSIECTIALYLLKNIHTLILKFVVVQPLTCVQHFLTTWTAAWQASLSFTISWSLLKFMSIESMMPSNHVIFCHPLPSCSQSFRESGSLQWVSSPHQVAKILQLQLQHQCFQWILRVDFL